MAIIKDKVTFTKAVMTIVAVDMGIRQLVFGETKTFKTDFIEYDTATVQGTAPAYNSFSNTAKVVSKDGKDTVRIAPVNFNESISKSAIDANATMFGETEYGGQMVSAEEQSALDGVSKLALNAQVGTKKIFYEALTTHKIAGGYQGVDGAEDIVFGVPVANKEVLDNSTNIYWTTPATAKPLNDMKRAVKAMKVKPRYAIMNDVTYGLFVNNSQVITDANSSDKAKNFTLNENIDIEKDLVRMGRVMFEGIVLDVYVESGTYWNGSQDVPYMADNFVAYAGGRHGGTYFGGVPVAKNGGVENEAKETDISEVITQNPPQHNVIHRSAPVAVLRNGEAFYSQQVGA
jgi:hypothetical protein